MKSTAVESNSPLTKKGSLKNILEFPKKEVKHPPGKFPEIELCNKAVVTVPAFQLPVNLEPRNPGTWKLRSLETLQPWKLQTVEISRALQLCNLGSLQCLQPLEP